MLRFGDGTQVRVNHLNEILADLWSESKPPNSETAEEILLRLEKKGSYIPRSARWEYKSVVLREYTEYIADRKNKAP